MAVIEHGGADDAERVSDERELDDRDAAAAPDASGDDTAVRERSQIGFDATRERRRASRDAEQPDQAQRQRQSQARG